jgi:hypothetical protein
VPNAFVRGSFQRATAPKSLGDLVDRGPRILEILKLVRNMVQAVAALCVPGNHDMKLMCKLRFAEPSSGGRGA